jgi:hypothetical protein
LSDLDTGDGSVGLAESTTHTGLKTIGTSARQLFESAFCPSFLLHFWRLTILLMRTTWYGCALTRMWKPSLPHVFTRYLLPAIREASRASELSCSSSLETRWTHVGNSSTLARFLPRSKMRILGSGTPRLKRDLGYGLFLPGGC